MRLSEQSPASVRQCLISSLKRGDETEENKEGKKKTGPYSSLCTGAFLGCLIRSPAHRPAQRAADVRSATTWRAAYHIMSYHLRPSQAVPYRSRRRRVTRHALRQALRASYTVLALCGVCACVCRVVSFICSSYACRMAVCRLLSFGQGLGTAR